MALTSLSLNSDKLLTQLASLDEMAKEHDWKFTYLDDVDQFFYAPAIIPDNSFIYSFNDEYSVYVDKDSNIQGIFVEYFKTNLTEHEKSFKQFFKVAEGKATTTESDLARKAFEYEVLSGFVKSTLSKQSLAVSF